MPDLVYNIALGRMVEFYIRIDTNDPANSAFIIVIINTTETDAILRDLDTLALVLANANTAEVTNTNYARITLTDADIVAFAPDDTNDNADLDIPDQTFSAIAAGDPWTDFCMNYDSDTAAGTDTDIVPGTQHDFAVTPDGSDITAQIAAAGFFRATE